MTELVTEQSRRKDAGYYANLRPDLVEMLPRPLGRVLDVGCGAGTVAQQVRAEGAERVVGIELDRDAAEAAQEVCDQVLATSVEVALDELEGPFDTVLTYDVLEHLVDPWLVLRRLREITAPGGRLQVSVPNARHLSLVRRSALSRHVRLHGVRPPGHHASALVHPARHRRRRGRRRLEGPGGLSQPGLGAAAAAGAADLRAIERVPRAAVVCPRDE